MVIENRKTATPIIDQSKQKLWQLYKSWSLDQGKGKSIFSEKEMLEFYEYMITLIDSNETDDKLDDVEYAQTPSEYFENFISMIKVLIDPEMIFVFEIPDLTESNNLMRSEVYVVINNHHMPMLDLVKGVLTFLTITNQEICIHPINISNVNRELKNGNLFFLTQFKKTNLIYKKKGAPGLPTIDDFNVNELLSFSSNTIQKGWDVANLFLSHAESEKESEKFAICVYFLHQSIELRLRALLLAWERYEKKTHEIKLLIKSCLKFIPELASIFPQDTTEEIALFKMLEDSYCKARYSTEFKVSQSHTEELFIRAIRIKELCDFHFRKYFKIVLNIEE